MSSAFLFRNLSFLGLLAIFHQCTKSREILTHSDFSVEHKWQNIPMKEKALFKTNVFFQLKKLCADM